jgi:AraC family transcriptional regulator
MLEQTSSDLSDFAAQIIEAASCARDGDWEMAKVRITNAIALLLGHPTSAPHVVQASGSNTGQITRGGLAAWQARRAVAYINANLAAKIRIEDLSRLVDLSSSHFSRAFKCSFGVSAHAYLTQRRIEVAQRLMLTTRYSLSEIALSCGMSDQSHFSRSFRRIVGETPYSWRRARGDALEDQVPMSGDQKALHTEGCKQIRNGTR